MRPALLVCFLILLCFVDETQGILLGHGLISVGHRRVHEKESSLVQASGPRVREVVLSKDDHYSGRSRKKMEETIYNSGTTTITSTKGVKRGKTQVDPKLKSHMGDEELNRKEENFKVKSPQASKHEKVVSNPYQDITEIAEMDYSAAKRKPPINN